MTCDTYRAWVDDYVDGALDEARHERLTGHLATCASCAALVEDVRRIQRMARALGPTDPPAHLWPRVAAVVAQQPGGLREGRGQRSRDWLAAAAGFVLVAGSLAWIGARLPQSTPAITVTNSEAVLDFEVAQAAYRSAIDDLENIADTGTPSAVAEPGLAELRAGLSDLDSAILEAETTLAEEPGDAFSQEQLLTALDDKVAILQDGVLQDTVARLDEALLETVNGPLGTHP